MAATASLSVPAGPHANSIHRMTGPSAKRTKTVRGPPRISMADLTPNNIGTLRKLHAVLFPVAYSDRFYKEVLSPEVEDFCKLIYYNDIPVGAVCCRIERDPTPSGSSGSNVAELAATGRLYLLTLGVLAPYRRQGLASTMITHVLEKAAEASLAASLTPTLQAKAAETKGITVAPIRSMAKSVKGKGKAIAAAAGLVESKEDDKAKDPAVAKKTEQPSKLPPPVFRSIYLHVQTSNSDARAFWQTKGFVDKQTITDYYKPNIEGLRDAWLLEKEIEL